MPRAAPIGLIIASVLGGCGANHADRVPSRTGRATGAAVRTFVTPPTVERHCAAIAETRRVGVLCPRRLPAGHWIVEHETLRLGPCEYLVDLNRRPALGSDPFHVLAGGRCGGFSLAVKHAQWPVDVRLTPDLGLVGSKPLTPAGSTNAQHVRLRALRRIMVGAHAGLLLAAAPYPDGGVHGGHTIVVWNQGGNGYTLTMHFQQHGSRGRAARQATVLQAATVMSRSRVASQ